MTSKLEEVVQGIMNSLSSAQQSEVKAWEEEITPCSHTKDLKQQEEVTRIDSSGLKTCRNCELESNLWLCLTCGNLGCGRAQYGGIGGNSHGLSHYEETGHPVSVKQGTITAEGTADIYCYACNDARLDPNLAMHLRHLGINVMDLSKTEKSMTELQLEQNLKFDFNMTGEDGKELEPVYGPGLTGLQNLGNSCYMASVLQSIFSLPPFHARYLEAYRPHTQHCSNPLPATCLECQLTKVADGLLSGRYSTPRRGPKDTAGPIFQRGIRPSMFKALIGRGHEEFATMRQQDADEFLKHLFSCIQKECKRLALSNDAGGAPTVDPTQAFSFALQQRLQCLECHKVRYSIEAQDAGLSLPVPLRPKADTKAKAPIEGENAQSNEEAVGAVATREGQKIEYEPVDLRECLDIFTAPEVLEYNCPSCQKKVQASKQTLFTTFPDILAIQVRRFQLINWVPQKVDVPILVPVEGTLNLDKYLGTGKREDEVELPQSEQGTEDAAADAPHFDIGAMSQLTAMGFPEVRCQRALLATGNTGDAEVAMNWLFAHMEDPNIDDPIDFSSAKNPSITTESHTDTSALEEMGFSSAQARKALRLNGSNPEIAVAWLFENPDDPGDLDLDTGEPSTATKSPIGGTSSLPAEYRIQSFISHKGPSVHSGHYVAHVAKPNSVLQSQHRLPQQTDADKNGEGSTWIFFNDEKVVIAPITSASVQDPQTDVGVQGLSRLAYEYIFIRE